MLFAAVGLYYKPDTRCVREVTRMDAHDAHALPLSIQTWALKEAKARMEARGEKYKYEPSTPSPPPS
jgi:hypothetical protein